MRLSATARLARLLMLVAALALPVLTATASAGALASVMRGSHASAQADVRTHAMLRADDAPASAMADHAAMAGVASMAGMPCDEAMPMSTPIAASTTAHHGTVVDHDAGDAQDAGHTGTPCGEGCCLQSSCDMSSCVATALLPRAPQLPRVSPQSTPALDARHATPPSRWPDTPLRPPIG